MFTRTLAFIFGVYFLLQSSSLPSLWGSLFLLPLYLLARHYNKFVIYYILFFFLGFYSSCLHMQTRFSDKDFLSDIEGEKIYVSGVVTDLPKKFENYTSFIFKINHINENNISRPILTKLNWYKTTVDIKPGDVWQLKIKLKHPYGFINSGGFDYEASLVRQGINMLGYVIKDKKNMLLKRKTTYFIQQLRYDIANKIKQLAPHELHGLILALSLGDRSELTSEQIEVFNRTGTTHLIAISGLHLGLIATFFYFIAHFIWSRFHILTAHLPATIFASAAAFIVAFLYALLAGMSLPTQRALIMLTVVLIGLLSARKFNFLSTISFSAILILLIDPFAVLSPDFWLSFSAVFLIAYIVQYRSKRNLIFSWVRLQLYLSLSLFPLLILWFKQVPLLSIFANTIAILIVGFVIVPLILFSLFFIFLFPQFASHIYKIIYFFADINNRYLEFISQQSFAVLPIGSEGVIAVMLALIGVLILLMPKGLPHRWIGIIWFLPLLFPVVNKPKPSEFDVFLLDVGQGLSVVVRTNQHVLLYDTGASFSDRFDIGKAVIVPFLRSNGIDKLSMLILSHSDNDHIGGTKSVLKNIKVETILTSSPKKISFAKTRKCYKLQKWNWDGVEFEILHPHEHSNFSGNNNSCVLKISGKGGSLLLSGDIEKKVEKLLVKSIPKEIDSDVLVVAHHGSLTSSSPEFINVVSPLHALFSAGYKNRFGFPKKYIMSLYEKRDVKTWISYQTGMLFIRFFLNGYIHMEALRWKRHAFWRHVDSSNYKNKKI